MSEYSPYGGFKWIEVNNESVNKILKRNENSLHGYFLEVDLECPEIYIIYIITFQWHPKKLE